MSNDDTDFASSGTEAADPEIEAIRAISETLESQPQETRDRILRWTVDKYGSDAVRLADA